MFDFLYRWCSWWPTLAFISGTLLGPWLYHLWFATKRSKDEAELKALKNQHSLLQQQLAEQEDIVSDFSDLNEELNTLRRDFHNINVELATSNEQVKTLQSKNALKIQVPKEDFNLKNIELRKKIKKLKKSKKKESKKRSSKSEYEVFLEKLEQLINDSKNSVLKKKAKNNKKSIPSKKKKKKKAKNQYAFYKEKFSKSAKPKKSSEDFLESIIAKQKERTLTDLYGITPEIAKILNSEKIYSFSDLSNTKIARLKEILSAQGERFATINPLNWPIQARIAEKGQWEILEEYKSKMKKE